jgi:hypothetical protein
MSHEIKIEITEIETNNTETVSLYLKEERYE